MARVAVLVPCPRSHLIRFHDLFAPNARHRLKIDRSFISLADAGEPEKAIACAVIAMAESMNLRVTAEGVETAQQLSFLEREDCDEAQGFLIAHPMPAADAEEFLRKIATTAGADRPRLATGS